MLSQLERVVARRWTSEQVQLFQWSSTTSNVSGMDGAASWRRVRPVSTTTLTPTGFRRASRPSDLDLSRVRVDPRPAIPPSPTPTLLTLRTGSCMFPGDWSCSYSEFNESRHSRSPRFLVRTPMMMMRTRIESIRLSTNPYHSRRLSAWRVAYQSYRHLAHEFRNRLFSLPNHTSLPRVRRMYLAAQSP